uniref:Uncharacterized protein n=1 Tax=Tanacetum cinerariifolium TaxID=118510 RepID=A0A699GVE7_TANCI|nr:hypothetical protein [Tanacetum cinerariifolium]
MRGLYAVAQGCFMLYRVCRERIGMENPDGRLASVAQCIKQLRGNNCRKMYAPGGSGNPTFNSPGDRRPTPTNPNSKEQEPSKCLPKEDFKKETDSKKSM